MKMTTGIAEIAKPGGVATADVAQAVTPRESHRLTVPNRDRSPIQMQPSKRFRCLTYGRNWGRRRTV